RGLRDVWRDTAYRATVREAAQLGTEDLAEIERSMKSSPSYQLYAWLERRSQQFKYYGRWGLVPMIEARREELLRQLEIARARHPERLHLDPALPIPDYVR